MSLCDFQVDARDPFEDSDGNSSENENYIDKPEENAITEVMMQIRRFLRDSKEDEDSLKEKLLYLGAINLSRPHAMEPKDLDTRMSIGGYREWKNASINPEGK